MKPTRLLPALGSMLVIATWADVAQACGGVPGSAAPCVEGLVVALAVFGIGTSASIALGRGSATLRAMALQRPSRGLRLSAVAATAGFAATTAFTLGLVFLSIAVFLG